MSTDYLTEREREDKLWMSGKMKPHTQRYQTNHTVLADHYTALRQWKGELRSRGRALRSLLDEPDRVDLNGTPVVAEFVAACNAEAVALHYGQWLYSRR